MDERRGGWRALRPLPSIVRFLGIDLGAKRTGVAVGDDRSGIVSPLATVNHGSGQALFTALRKVIAEHGPDALVVGLPLDMDGSEGPSAAAARRTGATLADELNLPIHYQDERLTTFAADQAMAGSGRTHAQKKALRDGLAAAVMLEEFLRARC